MSSWTDFSSDERPWLQTPWLQHPWNQPQWPGPAWHQPLWQTPQRAPYGGTIRGGYPPRGGSTPTQRSQVWHNRMQSPQPGGLQPQSLGRNLQVRAVRAPGALPPCQQQQLPGKQHQAPTQLHANKKGRVTSLPPTEATTVTAPSEACPANQRTSTVYKDRLPCEGVTSPGDGEHAWAHCEKCSVTCCLHCASRSQKNAAIRWTPVTKKRILKEFQDIEDTNAALLNNMHQHGQSPIQVVIPARESTVTVPTLQLYSTDADGILQPKDCFRDAEQRQQILLSKVARSPSPSRAPPEKRRFQDTDQRQQVSHSSNGKSPLPQDTDKRQKIVLSTIRKSPSPQSTIIQDENSPSDEIIPIKKCQTPSRSKNRDLTIKRKSVPNSPVRESPRRERSRSSRHSSTRRDSSLIRNRPTRVMSNSPASEKRSRKDRPKRATAQNDRSISRKERTGTPPPRTRSRQRSGTSPFIDCSRRGRRTRSPPSNEYNLRGHRSIHLKRIKSTSRSRSPLYH
jgi:hypothetical protein